MMYWRISKFQPIRRMFRLPHIYTIQVSRRRRLINRLPSMVTQRVYINFYHTDPSHTRHGPIRTYPIMPPPPHGYPLYQWPAYSGYPPQPCQLSCASSIAPAAQHKHGGNGEFSGRQGERGETS